MTKQFFVHMEPPTVTDQQKRLGVRNGKPCRYADARVSDAISKLTAHLAPHRPENPMEGPLSLQVKWLFSPRGKHVHGDWRDTKPDTDNLDKALRDVMTRLGFWRDDAQVVQAITEKAWWNPPGIWVRIVQLGKSALKMPPEAIAPDGGDG